jgi:hypothetical protein
MTGILQAEDEIEQLKKDFSTSNKRLQVKDSNCLKNQSQKKELIF